ncbi:MAG: FmdB family zinc ribbon protein [Anaerolineales bacterium]
MPIYEYICENCHQKFDSLRPIRDADAPISCKHCQSTQTHRVLSVFFAQSNGKTIAGGDMGGCSTCRGGNCASCGG